MSDYGRARQKKRNVRTLHVCVGMQILREQFTPKNTKEYKCIFFLPLFLLLFPPSLLLLYFHIFFMLDVSLILRTVYFQLSTVHYPVAEHCLTTTFLPFHPSPIRFRS